MPRAPLPSGETAAQPQTKPVPQKPNQPTDPGFHTETYTTTTAPTLAQVPSLFSMVQKPSQASAVGALDAVDADGGGLGAQTLGGIASDVQPSSPVGELSFENAGLPDDPMADLHMPTMQTVKIPGSTETHSVQVPNEGGAPTDATSGWRKQVVNFAKSMLGTPYVWGGTNQSGVDCSGLVLLAFKAAGMSMPRISADQARKGSRISLKDLKPGDLVAWDNSSRNNGADHIAIYIGNGLIIEAPRPGRNVQVSHLYDQDEAWGVSLG